MFKLSNISIGLKLIILSGISVALVGAMIAAQFFGNRAVEKAYSAADRQAIIARNVIDAKASGRGMQVGIRDVRLATSQQQLDAALRNLNARHESAAKYIAESLSLSTSKENGERLKSAQNLANEYFAGGKMVADINAKAIALQAGGAADPEVAKQIAKLNDEAARMARDTTLPIAAKLEEMLNAAADYAKGRAEEAVKLAAQDMEYSMMIGEAVGALAVVLLIASAFLGVFTIGKPLKAMVKPLEDISSGNFAVSVPGLGRKDEVGQIAEAVQTMAQKVSSAIAEIKASGREVTNASAEISTSTTDLSQRTEEQAASLEETSAAMEELAATVRRNAENAQLANQDANATREVADRGGQVVAKAVDAMARIEESSRKISDIIGVIDEIARQTNLLALNAAVEAARAGEAGRGFAVVASEVRSLAQRSSQAAKDIKDLITNSNGQVKDGVELVNRAGESLTEIVESIKKVATVVSDIANASAEQATGIDQINKALTQMDEVTQQNSALVEENAATAKTLEHQAKAMDEQVSVFKIASGHDIASPTPRAAPAASEVRKPAAVVNRKPSKEVAPGTAEKRPRAVNAGPARNMQTALATAVNADDWKEF